VGVRLDLWILGLRQDQKQVAIFVPGLICKARWASINLRALMCVRPLRSHKARQTRHYLTGLRPLAIIRSIELTALWQRCLTVSVFFGEDPNMATQTKSEAVEQHLQAAAHHHVAAHHHMEAAHHHEQGEHEEAETHAASAKAHCEKAQKTAAVIRQPAHA